jgi:hypothetical protein
MLPPEALSAGFQGFEVVEGFIPGREVDPQCLKDFKSF